MSRPQPDMLWFPAVLTGAMGLVGWVPTQRLGGPAAVQAMEAALVMVLVVVYATSLRAWRRMQSSADAPQRFKAAFRAGMERFIATLVLAGAVAWRTKIDARAFLVWVAISYVVMIKIETLILIRWSRRLENQT